MELEVLGGQVWTDAKDSSDSVVDGEDHFLFNGCSAAVALVAAFLFGLVGGSAITIDVNGSSIGSAKSPVSAVDGGGGAVMTVLLGFVGMRTLSALVTFEWIEDTALASSAIFLCFILLFPSNSFLACFPCWFMRSSVVFPDGIFGLLLAYIWSSACRSAFVPNFAKSELRILTSLFPGFLWQKYRCLFLPLKNLAPNSRTVHLDFSSTFWSSVSFWLILLLGKSPSAVLANRPQDEILFWTLFSGSAFLLLAASLLSLSLLCTNSVSLLASTSQFSYEMRSS